MIVLRYKDFQTKIRK